MSILSHRQTAPSSYTLTHHIPPTAHTLPSTYTLTPQIHKLPSSYTPNTLNYTHYHLATLTHKTHYYTHPPYYIVTHPVATPTYILTHPGTHTRPATHAHTHIYRHTHHHVPQIPPSTHCLSYPLTHSCPSLCTLGVQRGIPHVGQQVTAPLPVPQVCQVLQAGERHRVSNSDEGLRHPFRCAGLRERMYSQQGQGESALKP